MCVISSIFFSILKKFVNFVRMRLRTFQLYFEFVTLDTMTIILINKSKLIFKNLQKKLSLHPIFCMSYLKKKIILNIQLKLQEIISRIQNIRYIF